MPQDKSQVTILLAEDDDDDYLLVQKALKQSDLDNQLKRVENGEVLMQYLQKSTLNEPAYPRPDMILLDLNMPRKDGREALREIKQNDDLHDIPVIVFTTSKAAEDIAYSYETGVNSYISKPVEFKELIGIMKQLGAYWFDTVQLPKR